MNPYNVIRNYLEKTAVEEVNLTPQQARAIAQQTPPDIRKRILQEAQRIQGTQDKEAADFSKIKAIANRLGISVTTVAAVLMLNAPSFGQTEQGAPAESLTGKLKAPQSVLQTVGKAPQWTINLGGLPLFKATIAANIDTALTPDVLNAMAGQTAQQRADSSASALMTNIQNNPIVKEKFTNFIKSVGSEDKVKDAIKDVMMEPGMQKKIDDKIKKMSVQKAPMQVVKKAV